MNVIGRHPSPTLPRKGRRRSARLGLALTLALATAGCFQPMYGDSKLTHGPALTDKLGAVEVAQIDAPNGTRLARVSTVVRDNLIFDLTGGGAGQTTAYRLDIKLTSSQVQVIVDINTARPDIQNYGIDAVYTLIDTGTGKAVVKGQTFSRVSYNIPGQQQCFAGDRGLRDAEDRAAKVIADNIRLRLSSYFVAGS